MEYEVYSGVAMGTGWAGVPGARQDHEGMGGPRELVSWGGGLLQPTYRHPMIKAENHMQPEEEDVLLTPSEVAAMFRVNPKTVTRWARAGKISAIRTLGGHRRFRSSEIRKFLERGADADVVACPHCGATIE